MKLKLAWRNIWRNKKRTLITITSVMLAVVLAVFTRSFQEGTYEKMIENAVGKFTGYVQVHNKDYWDDKTLDNGFTLNDDLVKIVLSIQNVKGYNPRLESFSLASFGNNTKGALIMGVDPEKEDSMIGLKQKVVNGDYINANDSSVILGSKLAGFLGVTVGDTLVLLGRGHWGETAVGAFPVKGIIKIPAPDIDRQIIFMPLKLAQYYFSFENGLTSLVVLFDDPENTKTITSELNNKLADTRYSAMKWQDMVPEMVQLIQSDRVGGVFMISVLYMIIAFGVFGTVLMMTEERKREFSVMISIGMRKTRLLTVSFYETFLLNLVAIVAGIIVTIPIIIYYNRHPIRITGESAKSIEKLGIEPVMPTILKFDIFLHQIEVILVIVLVAFLYPLITILKLNVIKTLRR
jgi:ABC-type lipoprotein release transport system permease subunit